MCGVGGAAYSAFGLGCVSKKTKPRPPNFIVFFADDLGYGDLSCYGHPTIRTPHLDRMADEGVRLTSFYAAAPYCTPSRVGLLTGRYPVRTGQFDNLGSESIGGLSLDEVLIPQVLKRLGYKTMAIGKWHLGHDPADYMPTSRGFDSYYGLLYSNDMILPWVQSKLPMHLFRDTKIIERHPINQDLLIEKYTREAVDFIKASKDEPFFLYFPHSMPHLPVRTSERFKGRSRAGHYGDVIESLDWSVGRVLAVLKEYGLDEKTLVIFTSDNGPWLNLPPRMLQAGNERWHSGSPGLLKGAKATTYEGGLRVPCIIRWPNHIPAGKIHEDMVSALDIFTTVIMTAGGGVPQDRVVDGLNILPFLRGEVSSPRERFFYFMSNRLEAVRSGVWKLRVTKQNGPDGEKDRVRIELYHLDRDPSEQYNVADRYPETVSRLYREMVGAAHEMRAKIIEIDPS